mmetsp:Transcript_41127/g.97718  ORF Transcript_41127/g.97718 Transcript_41127/m.97718 type:complete len:368 (-) Transcript_41127:1409-2512(-)
MNAALGPAAGSGGREHPPAGGALHLDVHPPLQAGGVEVVVARRHHPGRRAGDLHRRHADHAFHGGLPRLYVPSALLLGGLEGGARVEVVVLLGEEPPRDEAAGPEVALEQEDARLEGDPQHEAAAEGGVGLDAQHVLRAAEEVQRQQEPRGAHPEHKHGPERLPHVGADAVDDLRDPEAVQDEDDVAHPPLELVGKEDDQQERPVEPRVEDGQLAVGPRPVVASRPPRPPDAEEVPHLEYRKDDELEKRGRGEGVEEGLDDDAGGEVQQAQVRVHDCLDADAEQADLGGAGLRVGHLHLPDEEEDLCKGYDGDHQGVVDGLGVVLLQADVCRVDRDDHAAVLAHQSAVHDQFRAWRGRRGCAACRLC